VHCKRIQVGDFVGIVCTRGPRPRCTECGRADVSFLCDWKLHGKKKGKTCSRKLCDACATSPAPEKHLCPAHARLWETHPANGGAQPGG
jgi:hypothetical protein